MSLLKVHRQMSNGSVLKQCQISRCTCLNIQMRKITISNIGCPSLLMYEPNKVLVQKKRNVYCPSQLTVPVEGTIVLPRTNTSTSRARIE
uniref:Putative ovule protein n=1 Tax=Solanum chacoense TaxID=4108 RepID=A0A0V0HEY5_SOLCH